MPTVEPLIRLEAGGQAPVLTYNLPEPAVYFGRMIVELDYGRDVFKPAGGATLEERAEEAAAEGEAAEEIVEEARLGAAIGGSLQEAEVAAGTSVGASTATVVGLNAGGATDTLGHEALTEKVAAEMQAGFVDSSLFSQTTLTSGTLRLVPEADGKMTVRSSRPASRQFQALSVDEVTRRAEAGQQLRLYTSLYGTLRYRYRLQPVRRRPRLLLVETYRLATYLGAYGAGPTIQTFSLLPGERTKITIRTFRKTEEERKRASSILDSFTEESAEDFEETIATEQADRSTYEQSFEYHAEAEAKASWGWGRARVSGGVKGGTNAAREECAKNTTSATNKHAQTASAKRQVEIDTSFERRETEEEENSIEREIENINVSRTLNFVFRQMNQEFITVLSLVDLRVAYWEGSGGRRREVPLAELDDLLEDFVKDEEAARVREEIREALGSILDHRGRVHDDFVEERRVEGERYLRVRTEKTSTYEDPASGTRIEVPGIILSATQNVMRTDGVMVEALLGVGTALDGYAERLQELELEEREAAVATRRAAAAREDLVNEALRQGDRETLELLARLGRDGNVGASEIVIRPGNGHDRPPRSEGG